MSLTTLTSSRSSPSTSPSQFPTTRSGPSIRAARLSAGRGTSRSYVPSSPQDPDASRPTTISALSTLQHPASEPRLKPILSHSDHYLDDTILTDIGLSVFTISDQPSAKELMIPILLNEHRLLAQIDTGASSSCLDQQLITDCCKNRLVSNKI
jgi:hypothetical protein